MSQKSPILRSVAWLSFFKLFSQIVSWGTTIVVARLLTAKDYGLMEMATIFTGYIDFFVEFGIGAAIINRKDINEDELSSLFWFMFFWGILLAASCLLIAPLTARYFQNPTLTPITTTVGIMFIITSLVVIPRSLLHREMRFKEVGAIDATSIFFACFVMLILAKNGAGVWTLLFGTISREIFRLFSLLSRVTFRPKRHFQISDIRPFIKFGLPLVASSTLYYIYNKSDRFFGGRTLGVTQLGFYAMALQLAAMPVEKIVSIFQSAVFPAFSKLKENKVEFNSLFLSFSTILYSIVLPLFIGGFLIADQLIIVLLADPKWLPVIAPFKILLIAQAFIAIGSPLSIINTARGKPSWSFYANLILAPCLLVGFYYSSNLKDLNQLAIPWISIYPCFVLIYLILTLRALELQILKYLRSILHPVLGTGIMAVTIILSSSILDLSANNWPSLLSKIFLGAISYGLYILVFGKEIIRLTKAL